MKRRGFYVATVCHSLKKTPTTRLAVQDKPECDAVDIGG